MFSRWFGIRVRNAPQTSAVGRWLAFSRALPGAAACKHNKATLETLDISSMSCGPQKGWSCAFERGKPARGVIAFFAVEECVALIGLVGCLCKDTTLAH